jgi:hypothetical protein
MEAHQTMADIESMYIRRDRLRSGVKPVVEPDWAFTDGLQGWHLAGNVIDLSAAGGTLQGTAANGDPALLSPPMMEIDTSRWGALEFRLKVSDGGYAQVFWNVDGSYSFAEHSSAAFTPLADNEWHTYRIPLADKSTWQGTVRRLRIDPTDRADAAFAIDDIRLLPLTETR